MFDGIENIDVVVYAGRTTVWVDVCKTEARTADDASNCALARMKQYPDQALFVGTPRDHHDYFSVPLFLSPDDRTADEQKLNAAQPG